jgi:hypothetical protein
VQVTAIVQLAPALRLAVHEFAMANELEFAPVTATLVMVSAAVPELLSVAFCAALATPIVSVPKFSVAGVSAGFGDPAAAPVAVPLRITVNGSPGLSMSMIV